ncbi:MAG TPA: hypothetical protein VET82_07145 [Candidatus Eisenbacteria bacterium]|nr:hypothetical protein [Candidatus Eisenbacteria bacterium]
MTSFFPLAATVISLLFAGTLWRQYQRKHRPYLLVWFVALAIYAVAAATEFVGSTAGWSPWLFRTYYFLGGIVLVGVLGLGTLYLLFPRVAPRALVILVALSAIGLISVAAAQLDPSYLDTHQVPSLRVMPLGPNLFNDLAVAMAAIINILGSLILIGGALWSAYGLWRRGQPGERLVANILIAVGAFIVAGASSLTRFGIYELFYIGQFAGVFIMFLGFLAASRVPARATVGVPAPS